MSHQSELIATNIDEYLKQHEQKELLRMLTCGSVDDGKSTLIGRLLHDSKLIYEDQLEAVRADSAKVGTVADGLDLALLSESKVSPSMLLTDTSQPQSESSSLPTRLDTSNTPETWLPARRPVTLPSYSLTRDTAS